jgi:hypothetical protein
VVVVAVDAFFRGIGLIIKPMPKDGNCTFHAFADQLLLHRGESVSHTELRKEFCHIIEQHWDDYKDFFNNDKSALAQLKRDGQWDLPGSIVDAVLPILARNYRVDVAIYRPGGAFGVERP